MASAPARAATPVSIDPLAGPKLALAGRVVTMNAQDSVFADGVVYVDAGSIVAVRDRQAPRPDGFEGVLIVETGGTLFPGLIELHNHLSYNALPLWSPVPRRFQHRGQWQGDPGYAHLVSDPMKVVGRTPSLLPSLVRYVECKCLMAGVTTSQGLRLFSNGGVSTYYRGIVRNVEQTKDPALPEADARIPDVTAREAADFLSDLDAAARTPRCQLLHLSEGITRPEDPVSPARRHFLALEVAPGKWAINGALAGIHASGLLPQDFGVLGGLGGSIVWSPFSNLLLYGATTDVEAARATGVRIGLGSDWSPTGSKNLLGELKVAWLYSQHFLGGQLGAREIVAMVTRTAAEILKWDSVLGSLEAGKRADILVIDGTAREPCEALIRATESSVRLVLINGVARYGVPPLMRKLVPADQTVRVSGETRRLYLQQATAHPVVAAIPLSEARDKLRAGFRGIRGLAAELGRQREAPTGERALAPEEREGVVWSLALDELEATGFELRPRLPYAGPLDFTGPSLATARRAAADEAPLSETLRPISLDPLTVVDDADHLDQIAGQPNVPTAIKKGLRAFY